MLVVEDVEAPCPLLLADEPLEGVDELLLGGIGAEEVVAEELAEEEEAGVVVVVVLADRLEQTRWKV